MSVSDGWNPARLRELLELEKVKGKPLRAVASEMGVSFASLSAWSTGSKVPRADSVLLLASHFGVSIDYLLGLTDAPTTDASLRGAAVFTGLAEGAVQVLVKLHAHDTEMQKQGGEQLYMPLLDAIFTHPEFVTMMEFIRQFVEYRDLPDPGFAVTSAADAEAGRRTIGPAENASLCRFLASETFQAIIKDIGKHTEQDARIVQATVDLYKTYQEKKGTQ